MCLSLYFSSFSKSKDDVPQDAQGSQPQEQVKNARILDQLLRLENRRLFMALEKKPANNHQRKQQTANSKYHPGCHRLPSEK
jgi:hypothetical protein